MGRAAARPFSCAAGCGLQMCDMFHVEHCTGVNIRTVIYVCSASNETTETGYKAVEGCQFRDWKTLKTAGWSWEKCKPRAGLERHAELCGPVFAQQFRLGHDGKRGLLLLVRGIAM